MNKNINYIWLSKYNYTNLKQFPKIRFLHLNVIIFYKQKHKYFLFINVIILLFFYNSYIKTRFLFKNTTINIIQLNLRNESKILLFLSNFINIYFPKIDSFSAEFKLIKLKHIIKFSFFKFPLILELSFLFLSLEHLNAFLNNYKFQINFILFKRKNILSNYNYLQYLKLPVIL